MKRIVPLLVGLCLLLGLLASPALAQVPLPHAFYGTVEIDGSPAPIETEVEARGEGVETGIEGNPITVTEAGKYGGPGGLDPKLVVQGDIEEGAIVTFYVDGESTEQTAEWHSGEVTELNLSLTAPQPPTLVSIAVTPESASVKVAETQQFTAIGTYSDNSTDDITTEAVWTSSDTALATVEAGLATSLAEGTATITATLSGVSGSATLTVTADAPSRGSGGATTYYTETNLFGTEARFRIESDGEIQSTVEVTSEDGMLTVTISKNTIALGKDGKRLKTLEAAVDESPPDPPEDAHVIGLAYDFGPEGANFDPPITFTWSYGALPEGVAEEDLVIACYDEAAGEWVEVGCVVDTENNITAPVSHFTTFAIIAVAPPPPEEEVLAPPEEEEVVPPKEEVVEPLEEEVLEEVLEDEVVVPEEEEVPPAKPINWPVIGGIIGAVVVIGLLAFFLIKRRAYY